MRIYIRAESGPSAIEAEVNDQEWNSIINGENRTNLYSFQLKPIPVQPQIQERSRADVAGDAPTLLEGAKKFFGPVERVGEPRYVSHDGLFSEPSAHTSWTPGKEASMDEMLTVLEEVKNSVKQEHQEAQQKIAALGRQIEFDRTCVADRVTAIKKAVSSREWLTEGRGSYEWDDDKWHEEFAAAAKEILEALAPLERIAADWSNCPRDTESVARARVDLEAEDRRLRAHNQQLMENLSWAMDLLDMYDKKLVEMGEPEWVVNAVIHLQAKAKAREALK